MEQLFCQQGMLKKPHDCEMKKTWNNEVQLLAVMHECTVTKHRSPGVVIQLYRHQTMAQHNIGTSQTVRVLVVKKQDEASILVCNETRCIFSMRRPWPLMCTLSRSLSGLSSTHYTGAPPPIGGWPAIDSRSILNIFTIIVAVFSSTMQ